MAKTRNDGIDSKVKGALSALGCNQWVYTKTKQNHLWRIVTYRRLCYLIFLASPQSRFAKYSRNNYFTAAIVTIHAMLKRKRMNVFSFEELGMPARRAQLIRNIVSLPSGCLLFSGYSRSGKNNNHVRRSRCSCKIGQVNSYPCTRQ